MYKEKIPGLTIVGHIDPNELPEKHDDKPRAPRPEKYLSDLKMSLMSMAGRLSSEYGSFFNAEGQMTMDGPEAGKDTQKVLRKETGFAQDKNKDIDTWRSDREKDPANITEMALTLLFDKILGQDFIIVRASDFDDYIHGADLLIIDKKTGAVICGVDDVLGHIGDDGASKKKDVISSIMRSGGAEIKYGATVADGGLVRQALQNIPLFYLSISKEELDGLLAALQGGRKTISDKEMAIFTKLSASLDQQAKQFAQDKDLDEELKDNLAKLRPSLDKILAYSRQN
jgi:hypothetical protein